MKKITLLVFCLFTINFLSAQSPSDVESISITGKVVDSNTNQPLEYATIVLKNTKTKKVTGGITDEKGLFSIKTPKGNYEISVEFISFKSTKLPTQTLTENKNFGTIKLVEDSSSLDEVVIIAEKSTVQIRLDKRIYNVGKDMTVKGGNASDVLDNVPSVDVDVEGNISLRGSENVRILIDGKPSALVGLSGDALKQLPAEAIERVEVITSPSARYDAEGTAGILNIILRKGKVTGFNGSLNLNAGNPDQFQISPNINYRTKKYNFFTNLGYSYRKGPGSSFTELEAYFNGTLQNTRTEEREFERKNSGFNGNFGLEYYLTKNSSITGTFFIRDSDNGSTSTNNINVLDAINNTNTSDIRIQDEDESDKTKQYSLNYTNNINEKGQKLTLDFQYSDSEETESAIINDASGIENNLTTEKSKNTLLQADYVLPIGEKSQFEAGYRGDFQDLTSDFIVTPTLSPDPSNNLVFNQKVNAFYTQYGTKFDKISLLLGLRAEITDVKVRLLNTNENFDYNYKELFPTINIGYEQTEDRSYTLGYSRRLRRPRFWYLNPFESRSSQNVIFKGNAGLTPTFTNSFDLGFLQKLGKFTINSSIYYQHSTDVISRVSRDEIRPVGPGGENEIVTIREPINLASEDRYGFEFTANYNPSKKLRFSGSFNLFQIETNGNYLYQKYELDNFGNVVTTPEVQNLDNSNGSWFARFNSMVSLPGKIQWQTRLFYRGANKTAQSDTKGIFSTNLAFSKDILKDKGSLVLNVSDVFNSRKRQSTSYNPSIDNPTSINNQEFQWRVRQISLNFTYRFNQKKKMEKPGGENNDGGGEEFGG
ncbi:TonB-dependent receptor family protein [Polaribacter sp. MSW13]|uniref:TonB-dependent receptor family protein n=1 Tax=Polaribacter marinus TaxID=2916838 RepID=A0A9X1VJZ9_9FLAO|nr:outer membrane beta-barrel family protein [Polaribacter marinus]MCI2227929.1 TonB-dependent receptor family protein [Polaribacter marinus]